MKTRAFTAIRRIFTASLLFLAGLGLGASLAPAQNAGFPLIDAYSALEMETDATVWCAVQDKDGIFYFGTSSLTTFDGERWRSFPIPGSYALRGLDFGRGGRLWAAAFGEIGWFENTHGTWAYHSLRKHLPDEHAVLGELWYAFAEYDGAIFVTQNRVLRWDGRDFHVWSLPGTRHLRSFRVDGKVYVHHRPAGLYAIEAGGPRLVLPASQLGDAPIFWAQHDAEGWLFVRSNGVFRYRDGNLAEVEGSASTYVRDHPPTRAMQLPDGRLAIGTMNGGIAFVTSGGEVESVLNESTGLGAQYVAPIAVDREGAVWAGSTGAVYRIPSGAISTMYDTRAGLPRLPVEKIGRHDGRVFLANNQGLYALATGTRNFELIESSDGLIRDFRSTATGLLTAGYRGVTRFGAAGAERIHTTPFDVFVIARSSAYPGFSYIADNRAILKLSADGASQVIIEGLPDIANSIAEDRHGNLWIGTAVEGVFVARHGSLHTARAAHSEDTGLPNIRGQARVAATSDGTILVFNAAGGWIQNGTSGRFEPISGHPARKVVAVSDTARDGGGFWVIHKADNVQQATVARVSLRGDGAVWQPHAVEGLARIGAPRTIFAERGDNGSTVVWIGGTFGVLRHEIMGGLSAPRPQPPVLRAFARRAHTHELEQITDALPYSTASVEFEFAAPEFSRRAELRLETRIEGVDHTWMPATPGSRRELTAMREGRYSFQVRAVAETGVASEATVFEFEILPPWWRTAPVLLGMVVATLPLAFGVYRLRVRTLRRRNAQLERKVRERTEELEKANAAKTEFVAHMSHDIRNPLNGIVGLALALDDSRLDPRQRELVTTLQECTTYLSSLVDDVLDFASIEAGRIELRPQAYSPESLLRSIVTTLAGESAQRGANLVVATDPELPDNLMGDAGRIQQILVNYVSNALKYACGEIRLSACMPAGAPGEVEFSVADNGPGISDADQANLFTKFTRLSRARHDGIPGTGLGLASCRFLADAMGGAVGVVSRPAHGTRFFLRLPLTVARPPATSAVAQLPNTTVLLVEDTDYNAWAASAVLSKLGLTCERARDGAEALRKFAEKRFNVVLLDRNLPDMDGTEVARRMREIEADTSRAVLLAVTAYCTAEDRSLCLQAGMDAFVGKPLTPEKLRKVFLDVGNRMLSAGTVAAPPSHPAAELDMTVLRYLAGDGEDALATQIERFVLMLDQAEQALSHALAMRDFDDLKTTAHALLGHARMVGGAALAATALRLESAAAQGDGPACGELLRRVAAETESVREALRRRRPAGQPA